MNEYKLNELKSVISNYIFDDKIEWLLAYIKDIILLRSKKYSIYFDNETIFINSGFKNPQLFLKRLYYDNEVKEVYVEVQENNKTESVSKILFSELSKENIIMISLKLLNNDLYMNQTLYIKKSSVESLKTQCDNTINAFNNELKNYLIERYKLDYRSNLIFDFEQPTLPVWVEKECDYDKKPMRLRFKRICLTLYGIQLITPDNISVDLNDLTYSSKIQIYDILK